MKCDNEKYEEALEVLGVRYSRDDVLPEKLQQLVKISYANKEAEIPEIIEAQKVIVLVVMTACRACYSCLECLSSNKGLS